MNQQEAWHRQYQMVNLQQQHPSQHWSDIMAASIQPGTPEPVTGKELVLSADSGKSVTKQRSSQSPVNGSSSRIDGLGNPDRKKLTTAQRRTLCRELATGELTRAALSRKYGVSRPAITQFAKRHAAEIKTIQEDLDNEFAAQWIARKELRVEQYQRDLELSAEGDFSGHYEQIRTRTQILRNVAEELGQLPTRGNLTISPVTHVVVGVDVDDLT